MADEAMSEGCALIANKQAGLARKLVLDGASGGLLSRGSDEVDSRAVGSRVAESPRHAAGERMISLWSPRAAAERLVALCEGLSNGRPRQRVDRPCSRAR